MAELLNVRFNSLVDELAGAVLWPSAGLETEAHRLCSRLSVDKKSSPDEMRSALQLHRRVCDTITGAGEYMTATATATEVSTYRLRAGQTLITKDSETAEDIGVAAFVEASAGHLVCGYHLAQITPAAEMIEPKYLYWAIRSQHSRSQMSLGASGVTRFGLRADTIANLRIPVPGHRGQLDVADHLDKERERVVALDEMLTQQVELLREHRRSLITAAVTGELEIPGAAA